MGSYSGVISHRIWAIITATLLITLLVTTHEPPGGLFQAHGYGFVALQGARFATGCHVTFSTFFEQDRRGLIQLDHCVAHEAQERADG